MVAGMEAGVDGSDEGIYCGLEEGGGGLFATLYFGWLRCYFSCTYIHTVKIAVALIVRESMHWRESSGRY